jgi:hypothetical protein
VEAVPKEKKVRLEKTRSPHSLGDMGFEEVQKMQGWEDC